MTSYETARKRMVLTQLIDRGIFDKRVLKVMEEVPRHLFVDEALRDKAYGDFPLPIGEGQTISQPYIVALMTEALELKEDDKVLEIGTGSGYQTCILAKLAREVFSIERVPTLAKKAKAVLSELGCENVHIRVSDGTLGWEEEAPFDAIIVTAASPKVPPKLLEQLKISGRLVIPIGDRFSQELIKIVKNERSVTQRNLGSCRFVPLLGKDGFKS